MATNYYPKSQADYRKKIKKYTVSFSLSDDDKSIVSFLENEMKEKGISSNAYIKGILRDYVNAKYKY